LFLSRGVSPMNRPDHCRICSPFCFPEPFLSSITTEVTGEKRDCWRMAAVSAPNHSFAAWLRQQLRRVNRECRLSVLIRVITPRKFSDRSGIAAAERRWPGNRWRRGFPGEPAVQFLGDEWNRRETPMRSISSDSRSSRLSVAKLLWFFSRVGISRTMDGYREEWGLLYNTEYSKNSELFSIIDDDSIDDSTIPSIVGSSIGTPMNSMHSEHSEKHALFHKRPRFSRDHPVIYWPSMGR
jgi:hypothetical protein